MLYFEIKIVIGLCSTAAVTGLALGMEYEWGQPKEVIHSSNDNILVYEMKKDQSSFKNKWI
jgi:hypothetical protein